MKILFKNALILTMKDENVIRGELLVKDNKIAQIASKINSPADKVIDCEGNLLMPGFKNAHAHTAMTFMRSLADDMWLKDWLGNYVFPMESNLTKEDVYHLTKLGLIEYLTSGITAAMDMYFYPPYVYKAYQDIGFRGTILTMPNFFKQDYDESEKLLKSTLNKDCLIKYALGFHAEYTSYVKDLKKISELAHKLKVPVYTHMSETKAEKEGCMKRHGYTPGVYLSKLGLFDYGGGVYHGVHLTNDDVKSLKVKNVYICTCPASNLKLASGIAPIKQFLKQGLKIAIGTDGPASNNQLDMFREIYLVSTLSKYLESDASSIKAFDVLKMATSTSAHMMGIKDADILAKGKYADIIMIDLHQPNMQPINNIVNNLVYSGDKLNIKLTMINGKILYYNNKFLIKDNVNDIYQNASKISKSLIKKGQKKIKK